MQLFVRCGAPVGTLALDCHALDNVGDLKSMLSGKSSLLGPCRFMRLQHAGTSLPDDRRLADVFGLQPGATLQLSYRLRGGGGDGGSTGAESRSCYLEMYLGKKADKVNPEEERLAKWTRCHLSGEPLAPPCVVDDLGNLFNKDAVIQRLLDKSLPASLSHITGLRAVTELHLHRAKPANGGGPGASSKAAAASQTAFQPNNDAEFSCPISGVAFNGRYRFVVLRPGGLVVSEKAVKEVPAVVEELAGKKLSELELLPINPTGEQLDQLRARVAARMAEKAASKKDKKRSAAAVETAAANGASAGATAPGRNGTAAATAATAAGPRRSASPPAEEVGGAGAAAAAAAKRLKIPAGASKEVYASIFSSNKPGATEKETFCCRALSARGMNLT